MDKHTARRQARQEHAFMLLCEGLSKEEAAARLGVTPRGITVLKNFFADKLQDGIRYADITVGSLHRRSPVKPPFGG